MLRAKSPPSLAPPRSVLRSECLAVYFIVTLCVLWQVKLVPRSWFTQGAPLLLRWEFGGRGSSKGHRNLTFLSRPPLWLWGIWESLFPNPEPPTNNEHFPQELSRGTVGSFS